MGSPARSPSTSLQHEEPQPPTTRTATGAGAGRPAAAFTPRPARATVATADIAEPAAPRPAPLPTVDAAADESPVTLAGRTIVPVNSSRATPTTSAITSSAAIGANGRPNTTLAGTDSRGRGRTWAAISASPYQALALTRPATAMTGSASQVGRCAITAPAAVSATKLPSSQATARSGGSRRHHAWAVPPRLRG